MELLSNYVYRDECYLKYKDFTPRFLIRSVERASELS